MRRWRLGFVLAALVLCPGHAWAGDEIAGRIERFMEVLKSNPSYFSSQEYDFAEGEMTVVEKLCGDDLVLPDEERTLCNNLGDARLQDVRDAPSLLLVWLRTKLPENPAVSVSRIDNEPRYSRRRITARLDDTNVVFDFYDIDPSYKPLVVSRINGVPVLDILDRDIKNGLSIRSLLQ